MGDEDGPGRVLEGPWSKLTPQEAQISRLVAQGKHEPRDRRSFVSPSTVEYHVPKVFRKLGVKSRTQLARRMA